MPPFLHIKGINYFHKKLISNIGRNYYDNKYITCRRPKTYTRRLKISFEGQDEIVVASEAQSGKEAVEKFRTTHPDVIVMDIGLPDISGIEATKRILELDSKAKVVILTSHLSEQEVIDALHAGACAYVMKDIGTDALKMIIKTVEEGAMWLDPQVVPILREKTAV